MGSGTSAVVLRAAAGQVRRPEIAELARGLDAAAAAMARRIPIEIDPPVSLLLETDFLAQGQSTGAIGEAVPGGHADLHLVFHPKDLRAYENALAATLLPAPAFRALTLAARGAALVAADGVRPPLA